MTRQKLALVVGGAPSVSLRRMNGFSPVIIRWLGSADMAVTSLAIWYGPGGYRMCEMAAMGRVSSGESQRGDLGHERIRDDRNCPICRRSRQGFRRYQKALAEGVRGDGHR